MLSVFHNLCKGRLDWHSTACNLRELVWLSRVELDNVAEVLADVGLAEKLREPAGSLSGEQQRVAVARALSIGLPARELGFGALVELVGAVPA